MSQWQDALADVYGELGDDEMAALQGDASRGGAAQIRARALGLTAEWLADTSDAEAVAAAGLASYNSAEAAACAAARPGAKVDAVALQRWNVLRQESTRAWIRLAQRAEACDIAQQQNPEFIGDGFLTRLRALAGHAAPASHSWEIVMVAWEPWEDRLNAVTDQVLDLLDVEDLQCPEALPRLAEIRQLASGLGATVPAYFVHDTDREVYAWYFGRIQRLAEDEASAVQMCLGATDIPSAAVRYRQLANASRLHADSLKSRVELQDYIIDYLDMVERRDY
jgi:hypothetical protein